ncbi:MAG: hypothetical protein EBU84_00895 [Actinobacteria bacterium]|nr:hypothetical protein [Actinomycetota bacterium]
MWNVALGAHVFFAVIVEFKNVFVQSHFFVLFSNNVPLQMFVLDFLFRHGSSVFEAPISRTHVIVLALRI